MPVTTEEGAGVPAATQANTDEGLGSKVEKVAIEKGAEEDDDDDEENDEDFRPEDAMEEDIEDENGPFQGKDQSSASLLSSIQQQRVDQAFEELFGYKWGTRFALPSDRPLTPSECLLQVMFGSQGAASILQLGRNFTGLPGKRGNMSEEMEQSRQTKKRKMEENRLSAASNPAKEESRTGNEASVADSATKTVTASQEAKKAVATGGMSNLLKQLASTDKVSTVAKTSADWDQFKEQTGLGEKLEEQAESKDAYLKRQDFLTRVDQRQFEIEREERERNRVKNNTK